MEQTVHGKDIALTQAFGAIQISVDAESEQLMVSFLASLNGSENELVAAFLASKAKEAPVGCDKFLDCVKTDKTCT
jgi:hypothetical protein